LTAKAVQAEESAAVQAVDSAAVQAVESAAVQAVELAAVQAVSFLLMWPQGLIQACGNVRTKAAPSDHYVQYHKCGAQQPTNEQTMQIAFVGLKNTQHNTTQNKTHIC
jgi:hypothetical protein